MSFHYGIEKRKFDKEWEQLEQEYRAAGMDDEQIAAMREYDWAWFCSQRIYGNRMRPLPSEYCREESVQYAMLKKYESLSIRWDDETSLAGRYSWIADIEDEMLSQQLQELSPDDLELLTLMVVDGYRQADIARLLGCTRSAVSQRVKKIKKFLKST